MSAAFAVVACLGFACDSTPPQPAGRLERPSGLAYVERSTDRTDVFVADSEAQGIRVLQFLRVSEGSAVSTFLPGPAVFFPLVVRADGFPTRLAVSRDVGLLGGQSRLFALAPATAALYVLDVAEVPYGGRTLGADDNVTLGAVDLVAVTQGDAFPVDVATLGFEGTALGQGADYVAVAFDGTGSTASNLTILKLDRGADVTTSVEGEYADRYDAVSIVETTPIAAGPRSMLVRIDPADPHRGVVLVSSLATDAVTEIAFALSTDTSTVIESTRLVDVGGPTARFVDMGARGVLALRTDRPSLVMLEPSTAAGDAAAGILVRSTDDFGSSFATPEEHAKGETLGRIDVASSGDGRSPLVAGAYGQAYAINETLSGPNLLSGTSTASKDVVLLLRADGVASFLAGDPLRPVMTASTAISSVHQLSDVDVSVDECDPIAGVCGEDTSVGACVSTVLSASFDSARKVRVSLGGALHRSGTGRLSEAGTSSDGVLADYDLTDQAKTAVDFTASGANVQAGDWVFVQGMRACGDGYFPFAETGVVAETPNASSAASLVIRLGETSAVPAACEGASFGEVEVVYEVHARADELVLQALGGAGGTPAVTRFPTEAFGGQRRGQVDGIARLSMQMDEAAACTPEDGLECLVDADCGPGRTCEASTEGCLGTCAQTCDDAAEQAALCVPELVSWRCPGIELGATASAVYSVDLSVNVSGALPGSFAAPDDLLYLPVARSWVGTFPANRAVLVAKPLTVSEAEAIKLSGIPYSTDLRR
ncbi:MAG: hypothetical protein H6729_08370 [Deltaproteobacteria bacterium]|nr:hypothetical protein [Deltaproteobacteria bacterium]